MGIWVLQRDDGAGSYRLIGIQQRTRDVNSGFINFPTMSYIMLRIQGGTTGSLLFFRRNWSGPDARRRRQVSA